jgi:hypothetical protein
LWSPEWTIWAIYVRRREICRHSSASSRCARIGSKDQLLSRLYLPLSFSGSIRAVVRDLDRALLPDFPELRWGAHRLGGGFDLRPDVSEPKSGRKLKKLFVQVGEHSLVNQYRVIIFDRVPHRGVLRRDFGLSSFDEAIPIRN